MLGHKLSYSFAKFTERLRLKINQVGNTLVTNETGKNINKYSHNNSTKSSKFRYKKP